MILILVGFFIYAILQQLIDQPYIKKIQNAESTDEALELRAKLKKTRKLSFAFFAIAFVTAIIIINLDAAKGDALLIGKAVQGIVMFFLMLWLYLKRNKEYERLMGNISTYSKDDYLKENPRFTLFLRGFETDDYSKERKLAKDKSDKFSEYHFTELIQNYVPVCAVGMTKEADSPYGATRLYVSDTTWKNDVRSLMEKAEHIFILVSERPSCLWEIEQSEAMLEKTTFIIDEPQRYEVMRNHMKKRLNFPIAPINTKHFFITYKNGKFTTGSFENTTESYAKILDVEVPKKKKKGQHLKTLNTPLPNQKSSKEVWNKNHKKLWIGVSILTLVFFAFFLFIWPFPLSNEKAEAIAESIVDNFMDEYSPANKRMATIQQLVDKYGEETAYNYLDRSKNIIAEYHEMSKKDEIAISTDYDFSRILFLHATSNHPAEEKYSLRQITTYQSYQHPFMFEWKRESVKETIKAWIRGRYGNHFMSNTKDAIEITTQDLREEIALALNYDYLVFVYCSEYEPTYGEKYLSNIYGRLKSEVAVFSLETGQLVKQFEFMSYAYKKTDTRYRDIREVIHELTQL